MEQFQLVIYDKSYIFPFSTILREIISQNLWSLKHTSTFVQLSNQMQYSQEAVEFEAKVQFEGCYWYLNYSVKFCKLYICDHQQVPECLKFCHCTFHLRSKPIWVSFFQLKTFSRKKIQLATFSLFSYITVTYGILHFC